MPNQDMNNQDHKDRVDSVDALASEVLETSLQAPLQTQRLEEWLKDHESRTGGYRWSSNKMSGIEWTRL